MDLLEAACAEDFRDMLLAHIGFDALREPWVYIKRYFVANHAFPLQIGGRENAHFIAVRTAEA